MIESIVIGARPGGIVCTKELLEHGISNTRCLEQSDRIDGIFATSYDELLLASPAPFSMFSDFWTGDGKEHHFWTKDEAVEYWSRYADQYGATRHIRFSSRVLRATIDTNGEWQINLESGETFNSRRLMLAVRTNNIPYYPDWRKSLTDVEVLRSRGDVQKFSPENCFTKLCGNGACG